MNMIYCHFCKTKQCTSIPDWARFLFSWNATKHVENVSYQFGAKEDEPDMVSTKFQLNPHLILVSPNLSVCIFHTNGWLGIIWPWLVKFGVLIWQVLTCLDVMSLIAYSAWDMKTNTRYIVDCVHGVVCGCVCVSLSSRAKLTLALSNTHSCLHQPQPIITTVT